MMRHRFYTGQNPKIAAAIAVMIFGLVLGSLRLVESPCKNDCAADPHACCNQKSREKSPTHSSHQVAAANRTKHHKNADHCADTAAVGEGMALGCCSSGSLDTVGNTNAQIILTEQNSVELVDVSSVVVIDVAPPLVAARVQFPQPAEIRATPPPTKTTVLLL